MPVAAQIRDRGGKLLLICLDRSRVAELSAALGARAADLLPHYGRPSGAALIGLLNSAPLEVCFVDGELGREAVLELIGEVNARAPQLPIVALLRANDPELILRCLRAGAAEFMLEPFSAEQWQTVWERVKPASPQAAPGPHNRLLCVLPGKGSCGASCLAINLAFQLRRAGVEKVLLADMNPLTGTVGFALKLKRGYSFLDALLHADRLDSDLWKALVVDCHGVDVLLSPEDPLAVDEETDPAPLLGFCRAAYQFSVLDTSGAFGDWNLALARLADELLVVTTAELAALHATQRAMRYLEDNGIERDRVRVLLNRHSPARPLTVENVQQALDWEVFHILPEDPESLQKSLMEGKPAPASSRFGKSVAELARKLAGRQKPSPAASGSWLLSTLLGRR